MCVKFPNAFWGLRDTPFELMCINSNDNTE